MKKIRKVLIANRGEIAVRIIRACKDAGIIPVAIYSKVDRMAPHVLLADEAYPVGAAPASESYLRIDKIIEAAKTAGADAIHPGYGFLAENAVFAQQVLDEGFIFIGPNPHTIELMGSKTAARKLMKDAGVPVVPGTEEALNSPEEARQAIDAIGGYPVMLKAAAGGGGKGMRIIHKPEELERAFQSAKNEARKAFGDESIYIEKYITSPRHIEIQIIGDRHGNFLHLFERECTIQRRHQKVVEECPSVVISADKRREMGEIAVKAARACEYLNAGTIEFIFDDTGNFYFLEMNTRLQVEHPVTELALGLDLVKLQLQVATGEPLPFGQNDLSLKGHAIECRINAEDVAAQFAPSTGVIRDVHYPDGPGIRVDSGVFPGTEITMYYDPLIAKLIAFGKDRDEAIDRMKRALREFRISGVQTTIPFCHFVMEHEKFIEGDFDTHFVENYWTPEALNSGSDSEIMEALAVVLRYVSEKNRAGLGVSSNHKQTAAPVSPWKLQSYKKLMKR